jgi:hypothetical protein
MIYRHLINLQSAPESFLLCVANFMPLYLDYVAPKGRMAGEWFNGKSLEGSSHALIDVLSWHLPGQAEENHEKT